MAYLRMSRVCPLLLLLVGACSEPPEETGQLALALDPALPTIKYRPPGVYDGKVTCPAWQRVGSNVATRRCTGTVSSSPGPNQTFTGTIEYTETATFDASTAKWNLTSVDGQITETHTLDGPEDKRTDTLTFNFPANPATNLWRLKSWHHKRNALSVERTLDSSDETATASQWTFTPTFTHWYGERYGGPVFAPMLVYDAYPYNDELTPSIGFAKQSFLSWQNQPQSGFVSNYDEDYVVLNITPEQAAAASGESGNVHYHTVLDVVHTYSKPFLVSTSSGTTTIQRAHWVLARAPGVVSFSKTDHLDPRISDVPQTFRASYDPGGDPNEVASSCSVTWGLVERPPAGFLGFLAPPLVTWEPVGVVANSQTWTMSAAKERLPESMRIAFLAVLGRIRSKDFRLIVPAVEHQLGPR